jgi:hypothetical protein
MAPTKRLVFSLFAGAALTACSSGGSGPTINSFTATPATLPAGGGSVTLAWSVSGATSLSIDQSVGIVTPVTSGSMAIHVTASTIFTLTAVGSSGNSTMTAQITVAAGPATVTVNGTVTNANGQPLAAATVLITSGTFSQSAVSDANGAFSVAHVPTPYNATIIDTSGTETVAIQYQGLTTADPVLNDEAAAGSTNRTASLAGQITGGSFPEASGYSTVLFFASPQVDSFGPTVATDGTFSGAVHWAGPTSTTGSLYALQAHTVAGLPVDFPGYGSLSNVALQDTGSVADQNVALSPVTTGTVSGTFTLPPGLTIFETTLFLVPEPGVRLTFVVDTSTAPTFSYTTPAISNANLTLGLLASGNEGTSTLRKAGLSANATGLALDVQPPPTQTLPALNATGVTVATTFSWTGPPGVYLLIVGPCGQCSGGATGPIFLVYTTTTTVTIPDLTAVGVTLPASTKYSWQVFAFGPGTSMDDFAVAVPGGFYGLIDPADGYFTAAPNSYFTTGP